MRTYKEQAGKKTFEVSIEDNSNGFKWGFVSISTPTESILTTVLADDHLEILTFATDKEVIEYAKQMYWWN